MRDATTVQRPWWRLKRTWLIGLPAVLVLGIVGVFVWGGLQEKPEGFAPVDLSRIVQVPPIVTARVEDGGAEPMDIIRYTLDATSRDAWVLFDFTEGRVVDGDLSSHGWDLAFRRTDLVTNSGKTNPSGPGGAANLGEVPIEDASLPDAVVFAVDVLGGEDGEELENPAASGWYRYSFIKHIVSVKPNTYLVRTGEDMDAMVQFDSYYCEDGESGCITFRYRLVPRSDPTA